MMAYNVGNTIVHRRLSQTISMPTIFIIHNAMSFMATWKQRRGHLIIHSFLPIPCISLSYPLWQPRFSYSCLCSSRITIPTRNRRFSLPCVNNTTPYIIVFIIVIGMLWTSIFNVQVVHNTLFMVFFVWCTSTRAYHT